MPPHPRPSRPAWTAILAIIRERTDSRQRRRSALHRVSVSIMRCAPSGTQDSRRRLHLLRNADICAGQLPMLWRGDTHPGSSGASPVRLPAWRLLELLAGVVLERRQDLSGEMARSVRYRRYDVYSSRCRNPAVPLDTPRDLDPRLAGMPEEADHSSLRRTLAHDEAQEARDLDARQRQVIGTNGPYASLLSSSSPPVISSTSALPERRPTTRFGSPAPGGISPTTRDEPARLVR